MVYVTYPFYIVDDLLCVRHIGYDGFWREKPQATSEKVRNRVWFEIPLLYVTAFYSANVPIL